MIDYVSKNPLNLQDAVRDLDLRLKALEPKPVAVKPTVTQRSLGMLKDVASHAPGAKPKTEWKPDPPKK